MILLRRGENLCLFFFLEFYSLLNYKKPEKPRSSVRSQTVKGVRKEQVMKSSNAAGGNLYFDFYEVAQQTRHLAVDRRLGD